MKTKNITIKKCILSKIKQTFVHCYNSKLGSGYNLNKDLSKSKEKDQLVKCKDTSLYLLLYISTDLENTDLEERERCS